jgi:hypothetical protein
MGETASMSIRGGPILLWLVATAAAIAVATVAISQVGREVVLDTALDANLAQVAAPETAPPSPPPDELEAPAADPAGDPADAPAEAEGQPADEPADAPADEPADAPAVPADGGNGEAAPVTRTYETVGGSAAVSATDAAVDVVWATPRPGFRVEVERAGDGHELRVDFRSDAHRSRIKVWVEGGELREHVEEDDRG